VTKRNSQTDASLIADIVAFRDSFRSAILATVDTEGNPESSYAPCVISDAGVFYVFVSLLARHTGNMLNQGAVSLMFIEEESACSNIFARRRLVYQCRAEAIERTADAWQVVMTQFDESFGKFMGALKSLPDFRLIQLTPQAGNYVTGFGKAYRLTGDDLRQVQAIGPEKPGRE
jgi:putative heme iron utilization protein